MTGNKHRLVLELDTKTVAAADALAKRMKAAGPGWASTSRSAVLREAIRLGMERLREQVKNG
jgi:hypothetical protein